MDQYSYNMLAAKVYELEAEVKRLRRVLIYNFKLACSIGVVVGTIPEDMAERAMEGLE